MADTFIRKQLQEAFLDQGIQDTNFFNGRLLTAADLVLVQKASRRRDQLLAQAIGAGVVCGLEVSLVADGSDGKPPILAVSKGLAIGHGGSLVALPKDIEVALAKEKSEEIPPAGFFDICEPIQQNGKPLPGKGAYLFVARPALDYQGRAPRRGFGQDAKVEDCDRDMLVEGVQFRLVMMDINQLANLSLATRQALTALLAKVETPGSVGAAAKNKLRNWLAHACFGTEELAGFIVDPFSRPGGISPYDTYGAVDALREKGLIDDCDVPLALVCWTTTGVKFVDMWSARRKLVSPGQTVFWPLPISARRMAEGEAMFYQFQAQIDDLVSSAKTASAVNLLVGRDNFRYLPPAGFLPLGGIRGSRGFISLKFFENRIARSPVYQTLVVGGELAEPLIIEGAQVEDLLRRSLAYPSIDLGSPAPNDDILIWVYAVRENMQAVDNLAVPMPQPYLVFTTGYMPYMAKAHYDVSRWDYSNYA